MNKFSENVINIISSIPYGKVCTYKIISDFAGNPNAARQVAWILHSCSQKYSLPWHRVINSQGKISLPKDQGFEQQMCLLKKEGVIINENGKISLRKYLFLPERDFD